MENTIQKKGRNLYYLSNKSIPYDLCVQIVKEISENRKPDTAVKIHRKVCEKCGKTFMYWEEICYIDGHHEMHNEKVMCDKCGGKLQDKRIWQSTYVGMKNRYFIVCCVESVVSKDGILRVSNQPTKCCGQSDWDDTCPCYINNAKYTIEPIKREVQGFTAEIGKPYAIQYYTPTKLTRKIKKMFNVSFKSNPDFYDCTVIINRRE